MSEPTFRTKPNPNQPGRCPSINPHDSLQCARSIHEDDSCHFGGIAWSKGTPRRVTDRERVEELMAEVERLRGELDAAQEHVAYHLRDYSPTSDANGVNPLTGDLAVDMASYAGRLRARAEAAEAKVAGLPDPARVARPWPENAIPTPEQFADWYPTADRAERVRVATQLVRLLGSGCRLGR